MTPKEKAKELVDKFTVVGLQQRAEGYQCALIAVDEILNSQPSFPMAWNLGIEINGLVDNAYFPKKYWQEVKQEIKKL